MLTDLLFFAALNNMPESIDAQARSAFKLDAADTILVLGAVFVIVALLFFWAFYIRKRPKDKHGIPGITERSVRSSSRPSSRPGRSPGRSEPDPDDPDVRRVRVRRRRRRHHPDNFPRNPTLGETGGLPPLRPEEPTEQPPPTQ